MGAFGQAGRLLNPVLHQIADGIHGTVLSPLELHGLDSMKGSLTGAWTWYEKMWGKSVFGMEEIWAGTKSLFTGGSFMAGPEALLDKIAEEQSKAKAAGPRPITRRRSPAWSPGSSRRKRG